MQRVVKGSIYIFTVFLVAGFILGMIFANFINPYLVKDQIHFSRDIWQNYQVAAAKTFNTSDKELLMVAFQPRQRENQLSRSYLGFYEKSQNSWRLLFQYMPSIAGDDSPLNFENMWWVSGLPEAENKPASNFLVTAWGKTGADYFGSYPVVLQFKNNSFEAVNFYEGILASDPQLKDIIWTTSDVTLKNFFDTANSVKTILTQGVSVEGNEIILRFYGDNNCHACDHTFIDFRLPLR